MPPLLLTMGERPPEALQWIGTSFGLTQELYSFWHRSGFEPLYLRQTASDVTGAWQGTLQLPAVSHAHPERTCGQLPAKRRACGKWCQLRLHLKLPSAACITGETLTCETRCMAAGLPGRHG